MTYKEEAPLTSAKVSEGLNENGVYINTITYPKLVNRPIRTQGKIIGYLEDSTFSKRVQGSKHMLRKPPGWCISKQAFCEEVMPNTDTIIIEDIETGLTYECLTTVFAEHAFEIQRGNFEPQLALVLRFWEKRENGHHQLNLWGGNANG